MSAGSSAPVPRRASLDQVVRLRAATGRGRYWLFTGDIGAALLAAACLTEDAGLPGLDDL